MTVNVTCCCSAYIGVEIIGDPKRVTKLEEGDQLVLSCTARNNSDAPKPLRFYWAHNSRILFNVATETAKVVADVVTVTSRLVIRNVTRENAGVYFCEVTNRAAMDRVRSGVANVVVICKSLPMAHVQPCV